MLLIIFMVAVAVGTAGRGLGQKPDSYILILNQEGFAPSRQLAMSGDILIIQTKGHYCHMVGRGQGFC